MTADFPTRFPDVQHWANEVGVPVSDAGRRYAQYLILRAVSQSIPLKESMAFKGGNALEFIYLPNRSTVDLDFSFINGRQDITQLLESTTNLIETTLNAMYDGYGSILRLQSMNQNPSRPDAQFPSFKARIAYALPDQSRQRDRLIAGLSGANVIPMDLSVNEVVCEWTTTTIGNSTTELRVSTLNDIVSEKLRAILQQAVRNRFRAQDIHDLATLCRDDSITLDLQKVSDYLVRKCNARDIAATKSAFGESEILRRSEVLYPDLEQTVRHTFIPFDEAWETVMMLVSNLDIPD